MKYNPKEFLKTTLIKAAGKFVNLKTLLENVDIFEYL